MKILNFSIIAICFLGGHPASTAQYELSQADLTLHSIFEQKAFESHKNREADSALRLLLAGTAKMNWQQYDDIVSTLKTIFNDLESRNVRSKSYPRATRTIYRYVQRKILKKYQVYTDFSSLFDSGQFNCVSSTAVFALLLDYFEIPYHIQLEPKHVYLVVDPLGSRITLESTDPVNGIIEVSDKEKQEQIALLAKAKLISEEEIANKTTDQLYQEYHQPKSQTITLAELAAAQYYNLALRAIKDKDFATGFQLLEKSEYLFSVPRNNYLMLICLYQMVARLDYTAPEGLMPLFKLYRLHHTPEVGNEIVRQFGYLSENLLFEHPDTGRFERFYQFFRKFLTGSALKHDITEIYYLQKAKAASVKYQYQVALSFIEKAYQQNPRNIRVQRIFSEIILDYLGSLSDHEIATKQLQGYVTAFPFLINNPLIRSRLVLHHADQEEKVNFTGAFPAAGKDVFPDQQFGEKQRKTYNTLSENFSALYNQQFMLRWLLQHLRFYPDYEHFNQALRIWDVNQPHLLTGKSGKSTFLY